MKFRLALSLCAFALAAVPAALADGSGSQAPIHNGCLPGYHVFSVAELAAEGYGVPGRIDAAGNADGLVCGKRVSEAVAVQLCGGEHNPDGCPVPVVYDFSDNNQ